MKKYTSFSVELPFRWIQSIRLIHAILETKYDARIPRENIPKARNLDRFFDVNVRGAESNIPELPGLEVSHGEVPQVRVGTIERPLIFPEGMVRKCRTLWAEDRPLDACFAGRLHQERSQALRKWARQQFPEKEIDLPNQSEVDRRVELRRRIKRYAERILRGPLRSLIKYIRVPPIERRKRCEGVVFLTSDRGWCHPTKAWDPSYFDLLSSSKFVLCPDGKFVWTYRFFESALCGAIPIVQNSCNLYDGFRYHKMDESLSDLEWSRNDARHNQELCRKRFTVDRKRLHAEIDRLLPHTS